MRDELMLIPSGPYQLATRVVGDGPLVILMHGWPELALSWRHQLVPLAQAGFTVAAPDMRGYGQSSKPAAVAAYGLDAMADDMAAIADALGYSRWVSIGHDWGSPVAWRTALRFPERVAAVFSLSVPHQPPPQLPLIDAFAMLYPDRFFYIRYFQQVGVAEAELSRDPHDALRQIYFALSGDAPKFAWDEPRPIDDPLLAGLVRPPPGPLSFMTPAVLDSYVAAFAAGGFGGPLNWYRNFATGFVEANAYGDGVVRQPAGFLCGDREITLAMIPGAIEQQRQCCADLRAEIILPGGGHWIQQERPAEVTAALLAFLAEIRPQLG